MKSLLASVVIYFSLQVHALAVETEISILAVSVGGVNTRQQKRGRIHFSKMYPAPFIPFILI